MFRYNILICLFFVLSCNFTPTHLGTPFLIKNPISIDNLLTQLENQKELKGIQVKATVHQSCLSEGCWLIVKNNKGDDIKIDVKDKKFRIPTPTKGKEVVLLLDAEKTNEHISLWLLGIEYTIKE